MQHDIELNERTLLRYDALLNERGDDALTLDAVDGLLTALVLTQQQGSPAPYYVEMVGSKLPITEELAALIGAHWREIRRDLNTDHLRDPILLEDNEDTESLGSWLLGFAHGMELEHAFWEEALAEESLAMIAAPLTVLLGEIPALIGEEPSTLSDDDYTDSCEELPLVLGEIDTHFKSMIQRQSLPPKN
jgi:yecA family protein